MKHLFVQFLLLFLSTCNMLFAAQDAEYSIVFIHIGDAVPSYTSTAIHQAKLFNPKGAIYLVANQKAIEKLSPPLYQGVNFVQIETLKKTSSHKKFILQSIFKGQRSYFWKYTSERFFYLEETMQQYGLKNVFHLENDNMLYVDLYPLLPIFTSHYQGIGATFDNDTRCIPGFVYIAQPKSLHALNAFITSKARKGYNDMKLLALFRSRNGKEVIDSLPVIMNDYEKIYPLQSSSGHIAKNTALYSNHLDLFQSIFDAAALGQYLGGIDPQHSPSEPGFINESCVFNPSLLQFEWVKDDQERKIPYVFFNKKKYRINSLHVHCKDLKSFSSH